MRAILSAFAIAATLASAAAQPVSVGTLTCSVDETARTETSVGLACTYKPADGVEARFSGTISATEGTDKLSGRVFVWLVYGPPSLDPADLEGQFMRTNPPAANIDSALTNALVGGRGGALALQPPAGDEQIPDNPADTILQLDLKAVQT
jgi:hypothetical protein